MRLYGNAVVAASLCTAWLLAFVLAHPPESVITLLDRYIPRSPILTIDKRNMGILTFFSLAEGEASLFQTAEGSNILIDTGTEEAVPHLIAELEARHVKELRALILSSPGPEHIGGLMAVLQHVKVDEIDLPEAKNDVYRKSTALRDAPVRYWFRGNQIAFGSDVKINVFWPPPAAYESTDDDNLVFEWMYKGTNILFTGDISGKTEKTLLEGQLPHCQILKVANHGKELSTDITFIERVDPHVAVIQGATGENGTPADGVVERLVESWVDVYRSDLHRTVAILIGPRTYRVEYQH